MTWRDACHLKSIKLCQPTRRLSGRWGSGAARNNAMAPAAVPTHKHSELEQRTPLPLTLINPHNTGGSPAGRGQLMSASVSVCRAGRAWPQTKVRARRGLSVRGTPIRQPREASDPGVRRSIYWSAASAGFSASSPALGSSVSISCRRQKGRSWRGGAAATSERSHSSGTRRRGDMWTE